MEEGVDIPPPSASSDRPRRLLRKILHWIGMGLTLLFLIVGIVLWSVDTSPGRRFLADRIAALKPSSGLRIRVGRIDGSIWSRMELRDLRLSDDSGIFLEVPELTLDWRPAAWFANRLEIRLLRTDFAKLERLPKLRPGPPRKGPILPSFDVRLDRISIRRLQAEPAITGTRRWARVEARGDIHRGRALIDLGAGSTAGDRLRVKLDAEPDRDRFDLAADVKAPHGGLIGALAGLSRPFAAQIIGKGKWSDWRGIAQATMEDRKVIDLALTARQGRYKLLGTLAPSPFLAGKLQRLSAPEIKVAGDATFAERKLDGRLLLTSPALTTQIGGIVDLATSSFSGLMLDMDLKRPPALFPNMSGEDVKLHARFDGFFKTAHFQYALTSRRVAFDQTGFENVKAVGQGNFSTSPLHLPVKLSASQVTGVGTVAGGILRNLNLDGTLLITSKLLTGEAIKFSSDKLQGTLGLRLDLVTGVYDVTLSGTLARYLIPGLGIVDVKTTLKVVPGTAGKGTILTGRGQAWVRRFDNAFLRSLAGGLPTIDTGLRRDADGIIHFVNLKLTAPEISVTGNGLRRHDGTFQFAGSGKQARYGPFKMQLDGDISRPKLDLALDSPMEALGLAGVHLLLDPDASGFAWTATGQSHLGPFSGAGQILLPKGAPATIAIAKLDVTGTRLAGTLRSDPGGFTGTLNTSGGGISGPLAFAPRGMLQQLETHLKFERATLTASTPVSVRRGALDGTLVLDPAGMAVDGKAVAIGVRRGSVNIGQMGVNVSLRGGAGTVGGVVSGQRGRAFKIRFGADLAPNRITLTGDGTVDRRPIKLEAPAVLTRTADGWSLGRTQLSFAGGGASLGGHYGGSFAEVNASLDRMPLSVLDIVNPELALGGVASGQFDVRRARGGMPTGKADLRIRGLTRSGLVLSSRPIDLGLVVLLSGDTAAARAVAMSEGKEIGRAQAKIGQMGSAGRLRDRLLSAPLFAQLRYNGPADTLWRLTNNSSIDLSGPIAIGADISGHVNDPVIRGSLRTSGARLESAVTGTIIEQIQATGRFGGSQLTIDNFSGNTHGGGSLTGHGSFDLASAHGFGMDLSFDAQGARILNRDDIAGIVTGPMAIKSDGSGGLISGKVRLDRGRFRLGRASAAAITRLNVTELNRPPEENEDARPQLPWRLDLSVDAPNQLAVTGLGLDSEWRGRLQVGGSVDNPAIKGTLDLVRGGYQFAGKRFNLDRGQIRFLGETPPDPVIDISASANVQGLSATIHVVGTGQKPEINFTSVPAMPEDELLSRLLFGDSITNLSAPEALQLAAAVASLRGGGGNGLDPINAIRRAVGLDRLRVLPADATTKQGTSVAAGKYIGKRTYVELITDGQGYSATSIEFQITRWLSLLSTISTVGRQSASVRVSKDY